MARIAFFTEKLPLKGSSPQSNANESAFSNAIGTYSFELIKSLADQQHEVRVMSTYREEDEIPANSSRLTILRPFRNWSWLEIPRLIPSLLEFQPQFLHFIQPHGEALQGWTNAMNALPALSPMIGRAKVVLSLLDVRASELKRHQSLLLLCDAVTVANHLQARTLEDWWPKQTKKKPDIHVVPLPLAPPETEELDRLTPAIESFLASGKVILVPGDFDEHQLSPEAISTLAQILKSIPDSRLVVAGGWGRLSRLQRRDILDQFESIDVADRFLLTGTLNDSAKLKVIARSSCVLAAALPPESFSLPTWIRFAVSRGIPPVLSRAQVDSDPLPWRDRENAFIVDDFGQNWGPTLAEILMQEAKARDVSRRLGDFSRFEAIDRPGNEISRMYSQLLAQSRPHASK